MQHPYPFGVARRRLAFFIGAFALGLGAGPAGAMRVVITNDDGFESGNLQALYSTLKAAGHEVILSAPYSDQSGSSAQLEALSSIAKTDAPSPGGRFAAGAPGVGPTTLAADQYYVNSYPATAARYGIDVLAAAKWGAPPDIVISGPNAGNNLGIITPRSGTVGAAITALNRGVPAIAVSGADGNPVTAPLLAAITLRVLEALDRNGKVALPAGVGLNVNVPVLDPARTAASYRIVFTPAESGPASESSAFADGNTVTISPIQGTFQARTEMAAQVLTRLRRLFASAPMISNPKMTNLSVRGFVGTGDAAQVAGFVVAGTTQKTFLLRAGGPALAAFAISGALADPVIDVYDGDSQLIASNDNWCDDPAETPALEAAAARAGAFAWSRGSKDAALV
ncbi:MAG: 5'/3'-nucleotidase SurE, partial [Verrucomicrobia bacterium]|nr:5'/3'-nucleotidase SurE [Verrucomicrobiota bacterium]